VVRIVRVKGSTVVPNTTPGTEATTQTVHDILADDGAPLIQHPGHHGSVEIWGEAFKGEGAETHGYACHGDVVFEADGLSRK
jgi:hypothetical protein